MRVKVVLPVRFTALGEAVQSTTRLLNETGAFIRCVEPPEMGSAVMLSLSLPGEDDEEEAEPLDVGAEVAEIELDPKEAGFWAEFVAPDARFLSRVRLAMRGGQAKTGEFPKTNPGIGRNRRTGQRYLDQLVVKLGGRGVEPGVFALNVSATGLFVLTPRPPELDKVLTLKLELPDKLPACEVLGLVVRRILPEESAAQKSPPGAGLVFIGGDDGFRKRYDAYLLSLGRPPAKR